MSTHRRMNRTFRYTVSQRLALLSMGLTLLVTQHGLAATLFWFGDEGPLWNTVGNWGLGTSPDSELPQDGDTLRWISGRARANLNMTNDFVGLTVANINISGGSAPPSGIVFNGNLLRWTGTIHSLDSDMIYNLPLEAASSAVTLASGGTFNGVISEATAGTMVSFTSGTISLNASNTWSGISRLYTTVHIQWLATKDTSQSLGQGDIEFGWFSGAGSLGSTLVYTGPATLTDKGFMIGRSFSTYESRTNAFLNNGTGAVIWAGPQNKATSNRNPQTFRLGGTNADANDWQSLIENNHVDSPIGILKTGPGTWILSGDNTYTGPTTISAGWLRINGDQSAATGTVTVEAGAGLGGSGFHRRGCDVG